MTAMGEARKTGPQPRVHYIRIPQLRLNTRQKFAITLIFALSWAMAYVVAAGLRLIRADVESVVVAIQVAGPVGPLFLLPCYYWWRRRCLDRTPLFRSERLERVFRIGAASHRLPHRAVEQALRCAQPGRRRTKKAVRLVPPRNVVCVNFAPRRMNRPPATEISFEPIDLRTERDRIPPIIDSMGAIEQGILPRAPIDSETKKSIGRSIGVGLFFPIFLLMALFVWLLPLGIIGGAVYLFVTHAGPYAWIALGLSLLAYLLFRLLRQERWFVVPGGLVYEEIWVFPRLQRFSMMTSRTHNLFIDMRLGIAGVLNDRRVRLFACPGQVGWMVLAGWISQARQPTLNEIRTFLGQPRES